MKKTLACGCLVAGILSMGMGEAEARSGRGNGGSGSGQMGESRGAQCMSSQEPRGGMDRNEMRQRRQDADQVASQDRMRQRIRNPEQHTETETPVSAPAQ